MPLLGLAFLAYVGLGLPDPLPGALWPQLGASYGVPNAALGAVLAGLAAGYIAAGLLAGRLIAAAGVGRVLAGSIALTALATGAQALAPPWAGFVALAVAGGLGGGAVDAGLNAYAAARLQPRHLNWLHGCYGIGATLGPGLAAGVLALGGEWQAAYALAAALLAALAAAFLATRARWELGARTDGAGPRPGTRAALRHPVVRRQMLAFAVYTGLEAGAGQWAATLLAARGAAPAEAAAAATLFFAALAAGRIGLGFVVDRVGPDRLLRLTVPLALAPALLLISGRADLLALMLLAVLVAPVYPTLMARTPGRVGALALPAIGLQVAAAMAGVALIPAAMGWVVDLAGAATLPPAIILLAALLAWLLRGLPQQPR